MRNQIRLALAVARDPTLTRIELAYFGFNMAEYATWLAILVYAYDLGGAGTAGVAAFLQLVPAGLVAPFAAYAGDRFRRDRVLLTGYVLQTASMAATAVAIDERAPIGVTLLFATAAATSFTLTRPVHAVILPQITHTPGDLTAANAVSGLAENLGIFLGPLIAGLLLARGGSGDIFAAFAGVTVVSAMLVRRLPGEVVQQTSSAASGRPWFEQAFGGFSALGRDRKVLLLVIVLSATTVVVGALDVLYVAVAIDLLRIGESWAGFLFAGFGLGGIVGAVATVSLVGRRRLTPSLAASGGIFGLAICGIGIIPSIVTAPILFAASGAGSSITTMAGRTLLQRVAPERVLARVFGVLEGLAMFAYALGSLAIGLLIRATGVGPALVVVGLLVPAVLVLTWLRLQALDRHARAPDPEAVALLRELPIFAPLAATSMERILADLTWLEVPAGHVLIREGERGDRFYVLADGRVAITQAGVDLGQRGPGEGLGEIALLRGVPRTATVIALVRLRLIVIERSRFLEAVTGHPVAHERAQAAVAERLLGDTSRG